MLYILLINFANIFLPSVSHKMSEGRIFVCFAVFPSRPGQNLAHNRRSMNVYWMNEFSVPVSGFLKTAMM